MPYSHFFFLIRYSQFIVGLSYEKGTIVEQDPDRAEKYYQSSADQGFVDSQAALGIYLIDRNQVEQGVYWLKQAVIMVCTETR
jgi:TPR repeat protein